MDQRSAIDPTTPVRTSATILVVDDEPANLGVLNALLQPYYRVRVARSGADALRAVATSPKPDLVLLDVMMPEMDGHMVLTKLRESPASRELPVIFVTAMDAQENERHGLELGAVDYITKPINPSIVLARVRTQLELKSARDGLADQNTQLEILVSERTHALNQALERAAEEHAALQKTYFGTLMAINAIAELRGPTISEHSRRVADVSRQVARGMGMSEADVQNVFVAALLHDIGKIGFADELLRKPVNTMNAEELGLYRRHPALGADALGKIEALADIATIVRYHHELFDGSGYPEGRSGLNIPMGARIVGAVSDYDDLRNGALTASPISKKDSQRYLLKARGHRYDPAVIDEMEPLLSFDEKNEIDELRVTARQLQVGMVLSQDVMHPEGFLLLSKNTVLERLLIDQLTLAEKKLSRGLVIFVLRPPVEQSPR